MINVYKEDIAITAEGTEIVGGPCVVSSMTVSLEGTGTVVVNFSDSADTYNGTNREFKVVIKGPLSQHFYFPKGKEFTSGLCATANGSSVDISVTYE